MNLLLEIVPSMEFKNHFNSLSLWVPSLSKPHSTLLHYHFQQHTPKLTHFFTLFFFQNPFHIHCVFPSSTSSDTLFPFTIPTSFHTLFFILFTCPSDIFLVFSSSLSQSSIFFSSKIFALPYWKLQLLIFFLFQWW